jgi:hypothetical protein
MNVLVYDNWIRCPTLPTSSWQKTKTSPFLTSTLLMRRCSGKSKTWGLFAQFGSKFVICGSTLKDARARQNLWRNTECKHFWIIPVYPNFSLRTMYEAIPSRFLTMELSFMYSILDLCAIENGNLIEMLRPLELCGTSHVTKCKVNCQCV